MIVKPYWNRKTDLQRELLESVNSPETKRAVNAIIGTYANKYVPMGSAEKGDPHPGELRESMKPRVDGIAWTAPYARYQYGGEVYVPNFFYYNKNTGTVKWWSASEKHPSGRKLGEPGELYDNQTHQIIWQFGYSTPNTTSAWVARMWDRDRREVQKAITNELKKRMKKL